GTRSLPFGQMQVTLNLEHFPWPLDQFERFVTSQQLLVRGFSVRNRQSGLGTPLIAVSKKDEAEKFSRFVPASAFLRIEGGLSELEQGRCRASLELYYAFDTAAVEVGGHAVPLESDTTVALAYGLNQSFL